MLLLLMLFAGRPSAGQAALRPTGQGNLSPASCHHASQPSPCFTPRLAPNPAPAALQNLLVMRLQRLSDEGEGERREVRRSCHSTAGIGALPLLDGHPSRLQSSGALLTMCGLPGQTEQSCICMPLSFVHPLAASRAPSLLSHRWATTRWWARGSATCWSGTSSTWWRSECLLNGLGSQVSRLAGFLAAPGCRCPAAPRPCPAQPHTTALITLPTHLLLFLLCHRCAGAPSPARRRVWRSWCLQRRSLRTSSSGSRCVRAGGAHAGCRV